MVLASAARAFAALLLLASLSASTVAYSQDAASARQPDPSPRAVTDSLVHSLRAGDAQRLLRDAADRVEISLFGARTFYSQGQAFYVVRDFFREHPPRRFALRDTVQTDASYFVTGRYWHERTDQPLTVFIRLQYAEQRWTVHEVRIEAERR